MSPSDPDPLRPPLPLSLDTIREIDMSAADPELDDAQLRGAIDQALADNPHILHELAAQGGTGTDPVAARALSVGGLVGLAERYGPTLLKVVGE